MPTIVGRKIRRASYWSAPRFALLSTRLPASRQALDNRAGKALRLAVESCPICVAGNSLICVMEKLPIAVAPNPPNCAADNPVTDKPGSGLPTCW